MANIWCPACGCEVSKQLTSELLARIAKVTADERKIKDAIKWLRSLVNAMEAHAQAKADVLKSVPEIYREWSDELLAEVQARFP